MNQSPGFAAHGTYIHTYIEQQEIPAIIEIGISRSRSFMYACSSFPLHLPQNETCFFHISCYPQSYTTYGW